MVNGLSKFGYTYMVIRIVDYFLITYLNKYPPYIQNTMTTMMMVVVYQWCTVSLVILGFPITNKGMTSLLNLYVTASRFT